MEYKEFIFFLQNMILLIQMKLQNVNLSGPAF